MLSSRRFEPITDLLVGWTMQRLLLLSLVLSFQTGKSALAFFLHYTRWIIFNSVNIVRGFNTVVFLIKCVCRKRHKTWFHSIPAAMDHLRRRVCARACKYEGACDCVSAPQQWIITLFFWCELSLSRASVRVRKRACVQLEYYCCMRVPTSLNDLLHMTSPRGAAFQTGRGEALRTWREWQWLTSAALHASSTSTLL